jgi:hypothetical protein
LFSLTSLTLLVKSSTSLEMQLQVWKVYILGDSWSLSLALSSLRYAPYLLVSLGDVFEYIGGFLSDVWEEVQLQLSIILVLWLWYFMSGEISLEKYALYWLSVGSSASSGIILSSKGYGLHAYGLVKIVILSMVKQAHRMF